MKQNFDINKPRINGRLLKLSSELRVNIRNVNAARDERKAS